MNLYTVTVQGNYAFDVILVKGSDKKEALSRFKKFVYDGYKTNNLSQYNSILDSIRSDSVEFVEDFEESDFEEIVMEFMLLAQFIE